MPTRAVVYVNQRFGDELVGITHSLINIAGGQGLSRPGC